MAKTKPKKLPKPRLTAEDLEPENIRMMVSIRMPLSLVESYRQEAKKLGIGYQTLMQIKLAESMEHSLEKRVAALERKIKAS